MFKMLISECSYISMPFGPDSSLALLTLLNHLLMVIYGHVLI